VAGLRFCKMHNMLNLTYTPRHSKHSLQRNSRHLWTVYRSTVQTHKPHKSTARQPHAGLAAVYWMTSVCIRVAGWYGGCDLGVDCVVFVIARRAPRCFLLHGPARAHWDPASTRQHAYPSRSSSTYTMLEHLGILLWFPKWHNSVLCGKYYRPICGADRRRWMR